MPINEKDLSQYFVDNFYSRKKPEEKTNLFRGTAEMPLNEEDIFEYDEEEASCTRAEVLILLAAYDSPHLEDYKKIFTQNGIRVLAVSSDDEFMCFARIFPINGAVADFPQKVQSEEIKSLLSELERNHPFAEIKYNPIKNSIDLFSPDKTVKTLDDFIEKKCQKFAARILRSTQRRPISLNVEISPEKEFVRVERTVTLDISANGLFIIALSPIWENAEKCFIAVKEFNSEALIECDVVRRVRWGEKAFKCPGIGVKIASIRDIIQDDFNMLLEKWRFF